MPINPVYLEPFEEEKFLHIICKSVGGVRLFRNDEHRLYFLNKYSQYTNGYLDTYSYILLDNHVHLLVKCKSLSSLISFLKEKPKKELKSHQQKFLLNEIEFKTACELQLKDFFIAYAMAFNKSVKRAGGLFAKPFKRIEIKDDSHLINAIIYIHTNVVKHQITKNFKNYKWSSFSTIISDKSTLLKRKEILELFNGKEEFIKVHTENVDYYYFDE